MSTFLKRESTPEAEVQNLINSLVDLFSTSGNKSIDSLRSLLVTYHRLLTASRLSNQALVDIPLPRDLDPKRKLSLPNRFLPLWLLIKDSLASLIRLPFFLFPLITHIPIYIVGILGARLVEDEMETQAQMKIALGLVLSFLTYPVLFFTFWAIFRQVPLGFAIAAGAVFAMGRYHSALIDENYTA
jgi:glycerol-3-phosphate O-acyltransferase/dihydroxyacetone phosphate acyltransferase